MESQPKQPIMVTPEVFERMLKEACEARSQPSPLSVAVANVIERKGEELIDLAKAYLERGERQEQTRYEYWFKTVLSLSAMAVFMLVMVLLTSWRGLISQEGLTFLLGTLAGYIFGILSSIVGAIGFQSGSSKK